jgi:hypothetical protein
MIPRTAVLGVALLLAGCSDGFSPTVDNIAGSYSAATLTVTTSDGTVDVLAVGGHVTVTLAADGTTAGTMYLPDMGEDGEDFSANLEGAWSLRGGTVTFEHEADTFLKDVEFSAGENRLTSEGSFGDQSFVLVLRKAALSS